jgi:hypothetical protein
MLHRMLLPTLIFAAVGFAATRQIAFTGGLQTGTVHLKGTRDIPGASLPDTLVLDSALRVAVFTETQAPNCGYNNLVYWFFLKNAARVGIRATLDTVWTNATTFPTTALWLDTARPYQHPSGLWLPTNLAAPTGGIRVGQHRTDELCFPYQFSAQYGFRRVVYFSWSKAGQTRYGKFMVRNFAIYTSTGSVITNPIVHLDSAEVSYALFDSASLDPTPMALRPALSGAKASTRLVWSEREGVRLRDAQGRLYNLHGKRLSESKP